MQQCLGHLIVVSLLVHSSEYKHCFPLVCGFYVPIFLRPVPEGRPKCVVFRIFLFSRLFFYFRRNIVKTAKVLAASTAGSNRT